MRPEGAWVASWGGLVAPWEELNFIAKTAGTFGGLSLKVVSLYPLWQCRVPSWSASLGCALASAYSERPGASWAALASFSQWLPSRGLFVQLVLSRPPCVHDFVPNLCVVIWLTGTAPWSPDVARCHGGHAVQPWGVAKAQLWRELGLWACEEGHTVGPAQQALAAWIFLF